MVNGSNSTQAFQRYSMVLVFYDVWNGEVGGWRMKGIPHHKPFKAIDVGRILSVATGRVDNILKDK